ncbi:PTS-dependent dihydroxyacetone kinase phosphotransferase subunit DhaM [Ktedonosporobacter rubrisoli]|uniref:phosphoenolpyruvate--glycerone phosphotransferase n=1 Tax=Ktedonosporobacter rubrisoli TaxID=2509675 RepID=A0A4P6K5R0_KTERU|nr:dihydroxyacetone kinase phosphoryl donor subunit DhaM [Ktedonosporobacter rubrisoli]QBD83220.1 PTS-dependent dihydroxyacetone kinase phosphotransferase subunit DhaM [Ktedonosporobacter rubrisoli]
MTVSLVIVSHSERLAHGVAELAGQMAQGEVTIAVAGGSADGSLGTSIDKVMDALQQANSPDGTLVLLDLGSAVMTTEMAIEALAPEQAERIKISSAPLVEGAVIAAVEASTGSNLDEVAQAAEGAVMVPKVRDKESE